LVKIIWFISKDAYLQKYLISGIISESYLTT
jgi:hypothetical protein